MAAEEMTKSDWKELGGLQQQVDGHENWIKSLDGKLDGMAKTTNRLEVKAETTETTLAAINKKLDVALDQRSGRRGVKTIGALGGVGVGGGAVGTAAVLGVIEYVLPAIKAIFGGK